jgi:hypothetical protein
MCARIYLCIHVGACKCAFNAQCCSAAAAATPFAPIPHAQYVPPAAASAPFVPVAHSICIPKCVFRKATSACLAIVPPRSACAELVRHSSPRAVGSAVPQLPRFDEIPVRESGSACVCREKVRQSAEANGVADRIEIRPFAERGPLAAGRGAIRTGTGLTPATSAAGLGSPLPHLLRDWAHPLLHLHRDWAHPCHICCGTGLTPCYICTGTGSGGPDVALPRLVQCPRGARAGRVPAARR